MSYTVEPYNDGFEDYWRISGPRFDDAPNIIFFRTRAAAEAECNRLRQEDSIRAEIIEVGEDPDDMAADGVTVLDVWLKDRSAP